MPGRINRAVVGLIFKGLQRHAPDALPDAEEIEALLAGEGGVALEPNLIGPSLPGRGSCTEAPVFYGRGEYSKSWSIRFYSCCLLNSDSVPVLIEVEPGMSHPHCRNVPIK